MFAANEDDYRPDRVTDAAGRLVILSGCSGGGKSTLLAELARRGHAVCEEPGRQVVREQLFIGGRALPWDDAAAFVELTVSRSIHAMTMAARGGRLCFFDRGIVDQVAGLEHLGRPVPPHLATAAERLRCHERVFVMPPWPEIFRNDAERRHSFAAAAGSYETLVAVYARYGYRPVPVPKLAVGARADFILAELGLTPAADCPSCG